jgi:hypothetical protein
MLVIFYIKEKNKKRKCFFGDYQPSEEVSAILEEKSGE